MSSSSNKEKMLTLRSSDNEEFVVEESVALRSMLIKRKAEKEDSTAVSLPEVTGECLANIIEYLKKHADSKVSEDDLKKFDCEFVDKPTSELLKIVVVASHLEIKDSLQVFYSKIANDIKDKSLEEIRKTFNIENDYTTEEEEKIRNEYPWAFEE